MTKNNGNWSKNGQDFFKKYSAEKTRLESLSIKDIKQIYMMQDNHMAILQEERLKND